LIIPAEGKNGSQRMDSHFTNKEWPCTEKRQSLWLRQKKKKEKPTNLEEGGCDIFRRQSSAKEDALLGGGRAQKPKGRTCERDVASKPGGRGGKPGDRACDG